MAAKKGGLGKGIDSLIPNKVARTPESGNIKSDIKNEKVVELSLIHI